MCYNSNMAEFSTLLKQLMRFRDERNWKRFHNPKDLAISLALEASELLEHFQWKTKKEIKAHVQKKHQLIADELADVFIYLLYIASVLKVDLIEAAHHKLKKSEKKYPTKTFKGKHPDKLGATQE
jgi:dCTP diphosphatase